MNQITLKESFFNNIYLEQEGKASTSLEKAVLQQIEKLEHTFNHLASDIKRAFLKKCAKEQDMVVLCYEAKKLIEESTRANELTPSQTSRVLVWLQKARHKLFGKAPNKAFLLKRIHDLEEKLQACSRCFSDYKAIVLGTSPIAISYKELKVMKQRDGSGKNTSYFVLDDKGEKVGIFKPDISEKQDLPSFIPRQMAAYLLDKNTQGKAHGALAVKAYASHFNQMGTLQTFKENLGNCAQFTPEEVAKIPAKALQYLTMHRLRIFERDSHLGNVLWRIDNQGQIELISIDHDLALPEFIEEEQLDEIPTFINILTIDWKDFPQMEKAFDLDVKECIRDLDIEAEAQLLQELGLSLYSINLFKVANWILQDAVKLNLSPRQLIQYMNSISSSSTTFSRKKSVRFGYLRRMIAVQDMLQEKYPDPQGKDAQNYNKEFALQMKEYICKDVSYYLSNT